MVYPQLALLRLEPLVYSTGGAVTKWPWRAPLRLKKGYAFA